MLDSVPSLKILRKVAGLTPGAQLYLVEEYRRRLQSIDPLTNKPRSDVINPSTGWIDNDLPRDEAITDELVEQTKGFALAGYLGQIIREFRTFADADRARTSARVSFDYKVEDVDEELEDEETGGKLAGKARRQRDVVPV